ncbi:hypothetical protein CPT_Slocum_095 [Serratia phage Slocum]|nr:hypothetical protein CPT_Slocum_095 [Serratia phage Slocum]
MAVGFGNIDNFQETIQATVDNGVDFARSKLYRGSGRIHCLDCGKEIPQRRREALPGVIRCVPCQQEHDESYQENYYNRRCSKDSQLR